MSKAFFYDLYIDGTDCSVQNKAEAFRLESIDEDLIEEAFSYAYDTSHMGLCGDFFSLPYYDDYEGKYWETKGQFFVRRFNREIAEEFACKKLGELYPDSVIENDNYTYGITIDGKKVAIEFATYGSQFFLIEMNRWEKLKEYDYFGLVLINPSLEMQMREYLYMSDMEIRDIPFEKRRVFFNKGLKSIINKFDWKCALAGFATKNRLVDRINHEMIIPAGATLNGIKGFYLSYSSVYLPICELGDWDTIQEEKYEPISVETYTSRYIPREFDDEDACSREKAVRNVTTSYMVEAGAGSGKTSVMSNRLVSMVEQGIEVNQICAVTFTNAAADELRERFINTLKQRAKKDSVEDSSRPGSLPSTTPLSRFRCKCALNILENMSNHPNICYIGTIDKYTGINLKKGSRFDFRCLPSMVYKRTNDWDDYDNDNEVFDNSIDSINELLWRFINDEYAWEFPYKDEYLSSMGIEGSHLSLLLNALRTMIDNPDSEYELSCIDNHKGYGALIRKAYWLYSKFYDQRIRGKSGETTYLSFTEASKALKDVLAGSKYVDEININIHKYFLIDEFQDTDPLQMEIFTRYAAKFPKEYVNDQDSWFNLIPRDGSLFVVGDPKQSIFHFRRADYSSYSYMKDLFKNIPNGEVVHLTRNFRSENKLINHFNTVFSEIFQPSDVQCEYINMTTDRSLDEEGLSGVFYYDADKYIVNYDNGNRNIYGTCAEEYRHIREIIERIVDNENIKIRVRNEDDEWTLRKITEDDILIISQFNFKRNYFFATLSNILNGKDGENKDSDDNEATVHMRTVHGAKGLQAPVIILSGSAFAFDEINRRFTSKYSIEYRDGKSECYFYSIDDDNVKGKPTKFEYSRFGSELIQELYPHKNKETRTKKAEIDRLKYVAATRAENILIYGVEAMDKSYLDSDWRRCIEIDDSVENIDELLGL